MTRIRVPAAARRGELLLGLLVALSACSPSPAELAAASTRIAAEIFATQTAGAPTPTPSRTPTVTPTPSRTPSPTPAPDAVVRERVVALYDGPGIQYSYLADLRAGQRLQVRGGYQECAWLKVSAGSGLEGWLRNESSLVTLNLDCARILPGTFRPYTGSLVIDKRAPGGKNHLVIDNGGGTDGIVVLTDQAEEPIVACYVRSNSKYTLIGIPDGSYRIYFSIGQDWSGEDGHFTRRATYWAFEREAVFTSSSSRYAILTLSLHEVEGGTGRLTPLAEQDFPALAN